MRQRQIVGVEPRRRVKCLVNQVLADAVALGLVEVARERRLRADSTSRGSIREPSV